MPWKGRRDIEAKAFAVRHALLLIGTRCLANTRLPFSRQLNRSYSNCKLNT